MIGFISENNVSLPSKVLQNKNIKAIFLGVNHSFYLEGE